MFYLALRILFSCVYISFQALSTLHDDETDCAILNIRISLRRICTFQSLVSGVDEYAELSKLISQNEDTRITADDLAFFLANHNYDATPMDSYVQVEIDDIIYMVVPNGAHPGLGDLSIIS